MSPTKKRLKEYCENDITEALKQIQNESVSASDASKKYKIPISTLRHRLNCTRTYKKKQYAAVSVSEAVANIKNKSLSAYAASKKFKIPVSTLRDRLKGRHNKVYGSNQVLSQEEELQLAEWVMHCSDSGYPKNRRQILKAAGEFAQLKGKIFAKGTPTSGWFKKFVKRNPQVCKRTPEPLGKASAAVTPDNLRNFFKLIETQFEKTDQRDLLNKAGSWWNVDETGFAMNPAPKKVYARKGVKSVHIVEKGKPKENITCTYAVSGDGKFIPPLITFKESFSNLDLAAYVSKGKMINECLISQQTMKHLLLFIADIGGNFGFNHTESGWMKGEAFFYFLKEHLYPRWLEMGVEFPIVLVIDGYSAHKSPELFLWCKQHDIMLLLLYPNSTHIMQVLDIAIFGPLKSKYSEIFEDWKDLHPNDNFTEIEFIKVLKVTNDNVMLPNSIINGWRASGLQPFNFSNIDLAKLVANFVTNQIDQDHSVVDVSAWTKII